MSNSLKRRTIFNIWVENDGSKKFDAVLTYVLQQIGNPDSHEQCNKIKMTLRALCQSFEKRWAKIGRHRERFVNANVTWLEGSQNFPNTASGTSSSSSVKDVNKGRPLKEFAKCSSYTQRRKTDDLVTFKSQEELTTALVRKLHQSGKRDSAALVKELSFASPDLGTKIKKARSYQKTPQSLSSDQALALMIDTSLSRHQYNAMRFHISHINSKLYPPYYLVREAKKKCYPLEAIVTESSAEIDLQSLIDHTVRRLCLAQNEVFLFLPALSDGIIKVIFKWGCDGADQNRYKQRFSDDIDKSTDESLFSLCIVPIEMYFQSNNGTKSIIWKNPAPSSTRYCRPIKFAFVKETQDVINREVNNVKDKIETLTPTTVIVNGIDGDVLVQSSLILCMIDGKVCNALASCSSTQSCYICGATPREMNQPSIISRKTVDKNYLSFGLSPLHAWIRFLECVLHIAYRLDIKMWQARGPENKSKVAQRKKYLQDKFKNDMGLLIDMPKQKSGNCNDGNTARRFFRNAEKSAAITGINVEIIKRFCVILECFGSGFEINCDEFEKYAKETRELYLREYPWYNMPVTVHKVLFHGTEIIASCIIPIGQMSEEAQEARNKDNRRYRELFTRKNSRINTNTDLLHRLLVTSDPFITSLRKPVSTKRNVLSSEILPLLRSSSLSQENAESEANSNESCDSDSE